MVERDEWETPDWLFNKLDNQYGFLLDCCANETNTKCRWFLSDFEKAWTTLSPCWMNPPFSKALAMFKHFFDVVSEGVSIYRCDNMETKVWQDIIFPNADWIFIPKGRVNYIGFDGAGSRFPSALIGIGVDEPIGLSGHILRCDNETNKESVSELEEM
jgi:site-specific DNA-methyltransferase (adenine-specific)